MPVDAACCVHDHDCDAADCGPAWSLHAHVATGRVRALNAAAPARPAAVLRPWSERGADADPPLRSDDDDPPELLLHVPFDGLVRITALALVCNDAAASPTTVRAFVNRDNLDFDAAASVPPTQEWTVVAGPPGATVEYPTKAAKWQGVYSVDLHLPGCVEGDVTRVDFVGFKGSHTPAKREAVIAVYEARPVPTDHKVAGDTAGGFADVS